MDIWLTSGILSLSAIFYALIALPVAVMTLMSGHGFTLSSTRTKLRRLTSSFIFGNVFMLWLVISSVCLIVEQTIVDGLNAKIYLSLAVMLLVEAVILTLYSYKSSEAQPWVGRSYKSFLYKRAAKTNSPAEAFGLGLSAVVGQFPIFFVPFVLTSIAILKTDNVHLLLAISGFSLILIFPLLIAGYIIKRRNSVKTIHKFIITEHKFLQISATLTLLIFALLIIGNLKAMSV